MMNPSEQSDTTTKGLRPLKADLHLHTGEDPLDYVAYTAKELISKAADDGFEVLSITNHHCLTFNRNLSSYAKERGILLIPGIELSIRRRHVLLLNPPAGKTFSDFSSLSRLRRPDTLVIAPHPYFPNPRSLNGLLLKNLGVFDAIEYCHFYSPRINFFNQRAIAVSESHGLPLVGNSDTHFTFQLGTTYSLIYSEKDPEAIFAAIRQNKVDVISRPLSPVALGFILLQFANMKLRKKKIKAKWNNLRLRDLRSQSRLPLL
jgi:predicted metal-dependent phosphoesterase TrpH